MENPIFVSLQPAKFLKIIYNKYGICNMMSTKITVLNFVDFSRSILRILKRKRDEKIHQPVTYPM